MDDCISRQAAIDAVAGCTNCGTEDVLRAYVTKHSLENGWTGGIVDALDAIEQLPSAQPERKTGRWIPVSERLPEDEYVLISKKPTKISGSKWSVAIAIRTADPRSRKIQWRDSGFGIIPDDKVLAWMPLPERYQERNEDT